MEMEMVAVECSVWIDAPRERVWNAITDPAQVEQSLDEYREMFRLETGAAVRFGAEEDAVFAIIAVLDTPCEFILHHPPQPQYYPVSIYTRYVLYEQHGGTSISIATCGLDALPEDIRDQRMDATNEAQMWSLKTLKNYLEG